MFDVTLYHPKIVHFTIALFTLAVLFDLLGLITKKRLFQSAAWLNLIFAGAAAVVTVVTGLLAASNVSHNDSAHKVMETHETIGFIVLGIILLLLAWRIVLKGRFPGKSAFLYILLALAGVGFTFAGAYYGGELVYKHGVAVKAVPVVEEGPGHEHSDSDHEQGAPASEHLDGKAGSGDRPGSNKSTSIETRNAPGGQGEGFGSEGNNHTDPDSTEHVHDE